MTTDFVKYNQFEFVAESYEAAVEKLNTENFTVMKNATQAFKNAKKAAGSWTSRDTEDFCKSYLLKNTKLTPGCGCIIVLDASIGDTRERPYTVTNVKHEGGKRTEKSVFVWIDDETGAEIVEIEGTKAAAAEAIKEIIANGEFKGTATCIKRKNLSDPVVMTAKYTPSKGAKNGTYFAFGVEK